VAIGVPVTVCRESGTCFALTVGRCNMDRRQCASSVEEMDMGKYVLGWLLGVPAVVLVVLWFFFR
jgi:hypothetical protein